MTKVDIFSGFLGAGKTTLIKKLIREAYAGEKLVLIENEFGDIGIDGGFMAEAGIQVNEMNSGCICCSLVGDFSRALEQVIRQYAPDRILIEPSGVGKLSDIIRAVNGIEGLVITSAVAVADAGKCRMYMKNFGEFYADQIRSAGTIILSRSQNLSGEKLDKAIALLREHNSEALIVTTPWDQLSGEDIVHAMEEGSTLERELEELHHKHEHHHHHHHECDDPDCDCHEHHHHHHHECDDPDCDCHEHHHHHHHECDDPDCDCHEHHHADEVFTSWGVETPRKYSEEQMSSILEALDDEHEYGFVLRAKGIVDSGEAPWIHFDHVPGENQLRRGAAAVTGRICVIGSKLNIEALRRLFEV